MRSLLLPCVRKYAEVGMWFRFYERWSTEVDHLDITFDLPHGKALTQMVDDSEAEYLLFCEMDGIIFKPGIVNKYFTILESGQYDVIGSPRMSCTPQIAKIAEDRFHLDYSGLGDKGPAFWPNFFFVKRELLLKTDMDFGNHNWKKEESLLGETLTEDNSGDTMVWMSLQLRELGAKILEIPQYHSHPNDLEDYKVHAGIFDGNASWVHLGSISGDSFEPKTDMERLELTKRLAWRSLCNGYISLEELALVREDEFKEFIRVYKELLGI